MARLAPLILGGSIALSVLVLPGCDTPSPDIEWRIPMLAADPEMVAIPEDVEVLPIDAPTTAVRALGSPRLMEFSARYRASVKTGDGFERILLEDTDSGGAFSFKAYRTPSAIRGHDTEAISALCQGLTPPDMELERRFAVARDFAASFASEADFFDSVFAATPAKAQSATDDRHRTQLVALLEVKEDYHGMDVRVVGDRTLVFLNYSEKTAIVASKTSGTRAALFFDQDADDSEMLETAEAAARGCLAH